MLKQLSSLSYNIDKKGTITVNLGNGDVLKISPIEILTIADEIIKIHPDFTKLFAAQNMYVHMLNSLDIPPNVVEEIKYRLRKNPDRKDPEKHKDLMNLIKAFVNEDNSSSEFEFEEFKPLGPYTKEQIQLILQNNGFNVIINGDSLIVSLGAENEKDKRSQ